MKNKNNNSKKNKWRKRIIYGLGATAGVGTIAGGIAIARNKDKIQSYFKNSKNLENNKKRKKSITIKEKKERVLKRLTPNQINSLKNKYGYDIENFKFNPNVSKSSKRKGKKLIKSLGLFNRKNILKYF